MNGESKYLCPICGADNMCTEFTDGFKWGRAYCNSCDCGGPEVRTGYDENLDAPWRVEARKQFVEVVNEYVSKRGPQPDPITGLVPCGCGGKVEQEDFHNGFYPYSRVTRRGCWTETTRCRCTTKDAHEMARIGWNASHGYTASPLSGAIWPDAGEMAPNGDEGATHE